MKSSTKKIDNWVKSLSKEVRGGNIFFDRIDDLIKSDKIIIKDLFEKIYSEFGYDFNLVVSGEIGRIILNMIKRKELSCNGEKLLVSGGLTSHFNDMDKIKKIKEILIEYATIGGFKNKDFIFVDDSYYSGTTERSIDHFLNKYGSKIIKTYVVYDGNDKISEDRISLYRYYEWNKGSKRTPGEIFNELSKYDVPKEEFESRILSGEIESIIQLRKEINEYLKKTGNREIDVYKRVRESVKSYNDFINESVIDKKIRRRNNEIHRTCEKYYISNYTINGDGSIDVDGDVIIYNRNLKKLPLKFRNINGGFNCDDNKLTTLEGCPINVYGNFSCMDNWIRSLDHCPKSVSGVFRCSFNKITSLEGIPGNPKSILSRFNHLKDVKGIKDGWSGSIDVERNPVYEIFKLFPRHRWDEVVEYLNEYDVIRNGELVILQRLEQVFYDMGLEVPEIDQIAGYEIQY
jgi:hypothetical protein